MSAVLLLSLLISIVLGAASGLAGGALVLRAAVAWYNRLAGGAGADPAVPPPPFGRAVKIVLLATLANFGVATLVYLGMFVLWIVLFNVGRDAGLLASPNARIDGASPPPPIAALIPLGVCLLITPRIFAAMLPATRRQAALVMFCHLGLCVPVIVAVYLILIASAAVRS